MSNSELAYSGFILRLELCFLHFLSHLRL